MLPYIPCKELKETIFRWFCFLFCTMCIQCEIDDVYLLQSDSFFFSPSAHKSRNDLCFSSPNLSNI